VTRRSALHYAVLMGRSTLGSLCWVVVAALLLGTLGGWGLRRWVDAREARVPMPVHSELSRTIRVRATLVAPDGLVSPHSLVRYWSRDLGASYSSSDEPDHADIATVNAASAIELDFPRPGPAAHIRFIVQTRTEPPVEGIFELAGSFHSETFDAGRVELRPVEVIASGRVIGVNGESVVGAHIELESRLHAAEVPSVDAVVAAARADGFEPNQLRTKLTSADRWDTGPRRTTYSAAGGMFWFVSSEHIERVRVRARLQDGEETDWLELEFPPRSPCRLELPTTATLSGRVIVAPGIPLESLELRVFVPSESPSWWSRYRSAAVANDGTWRVTGVPVGSRRALEVVVNGSSLALARSETFLVADGDNERPPLDLSDVHVLDLDVVDEHGARIGEVAARCGASGAGERQFFFTRDERLRLWTREPHAEVWLGAPGRRGAHLERVTSGQRVVLLPALKLQVSIDGIDRLPSSNYALGASLHPVEGPDGAPPDFDGHEFSLPLDARGRVELEATRVGPRDLKLSFLMRTSGPTWVLPFWSTRIEVGEAPTQEVTIELGADAPAAAQAMLDRL